MKRKKLNRRHLALRWLAALLALAVFIWAAEVHCFTPGQALRKMARQLDLGELQLLESMDGQMFQDFTRRNCEQVYILQNQELTCLTFSTYDWLYGWHCYFPEIMEHGEQTSVPVDFLVDFVEVRAEDKSLFGKEYILGIILDPAVETVEVSLGKTVWEEDVAVWATTEMISLSREEWGEGPYYDYFFYMFDANDISLGIQIRALDENDEPITWTDQKGNRVEWYNYRWYYDFYDDPWNHLNGERD